MKRRAFLRNTAIGITAVAGASLAGLRADASQGNDSGAASSSASSSNAAGEKIGRPVRIVSIGFPASDPPPLEEIVKRVDQEGANSPDVILLPELCQGQKEGTEEPIHGATVTAMAQLAKKHKTYIAVPIDRRDGDLRLNSTVFLDRSGQVACIYNKLFPYWSEFDVHPPVSPGKSSEVYQADFGRVGFATCFDANFPEVWQSLSDKGAELVIWPSAYGARSSLQSHAINHHYYIVSCTQVPDCMVYDITGEQIVNQRSSGFNTTRVTLDLDRAIFHQNFNMEKRDNLLKEHSEDIAQDKWLDSEQWFVLKATRPGVSARELTREYGMEELRHYVQRSRKAIDHRRGWEYAGKVAASDADLG